MNNIKRLIDNHSSGRKVLWFFILSNLIYFTMLLVTIPKTMDYSNGMNLLDMMPLGYDSSYILSLFENLGKEGRHIYLFYQLPLDLFYPFLYTISFVLMIAYFLKKLNKFNSALFYLYMLPIIAGITDYLENIGIISMLNSYPQVSETLMASTNIFTIIKSITVTLTFLIIIIQLMALGIKTIKQRRTSASNKHSLE
ncbi:MAG: hypothetical protein ACQETL_18605 [Bacteroidota bacterium]